MTAVCLESSVAANLAAVRQRMAAAAARAGRSVAEVCLVAVSKTFGPEYIRAAYAAGQRVFGENRVQEALQKIAATSDASIEWHLVGHLQSNKVRKAVGPFALIQSVDSLELLTRLDRVAEEMARDVAVLVQVDLAGEPTKFGAPESEARAILAAARTCRRVRVRGLMVLPPWFDDPERTRPYFRRLRAFRDECLAAGLPAGMLHDLSMGMSHDFEVAIEEGATIIRVGTAIFGPRAASQADASPTGHVGT